MSTRLPLSSLSAAVLYSHFHPHRVGHFLSNSDLISSDLPVQRRRPFRLVVSLAVSMGALLLLASRLSIGWADLLAADISIPALVAAQLVLWASLPIRAAQWSALVGRQVAKPFFPLLASHALGAYADIFLPFRGGEVARIATAIRLARMKVSTAMVSLAAVRIADFPVVFLLGGLTFALVPRTRNGVLELLSSLRESVGGLVPFLLTSLATAAGLTCLCFAVAVSLFGRSRLRESQLPERLMRGFLKGKETFAVFDASAFLLGVSAALCCWALYVASAIPLLVALSVPVGDLLPVALMVTFCAAMAQMIPAAPSAIGTFHLAVIWALHIVAPDIGEPTSVMFAIQLHLLGSIGMAIPGMLVIPILGIWERKKL